MKHRTIQRTVRIICTALSVFLFAGLAGAQEFQAEVTRTMKGVAESGMLYVKGEKSRTDLAPPSMGMGSGMSKNAFMITDKDAEKIYIIDPDKKSYSEMPMRGMADPDSVAKMVQQMGGTVTEAGTETIAGYACKKVIYAYPDERMGKTTQWLASDLGGHALKTIVDNPFMSMTIEVKSVKETNVPDSRFEIPAGYQKDAGGGFGMGQWK